MNKWGLLFLSLALVFSPNAQASPMPAGYSELQGDYQHQAQIETLFRAVKARDLEALMACYHPQAEMEDTLFGHLNRSEIQALWAMLFAQNGENFVFQYGPMLSSENQVFVQLKAWYPFPPTGFPVFNQVQSQFTFKTGLIYRQKDQFDLPRWSGMALGPLGSLWGGMPWFQAQLRSLARSELQLFIKRSMQTKLLN